MHLSQSISVFFFAPANDRGIIVEQMLVVGKGEKENVRWNVRQDKSHMNDWCTVLLITIGTLDGYVDNVKYLLKKCIKWNSFFPQRTCVWYKKADKQLKEKQIGGKKM